MIKSQELLWTPQEYAEHIDVPHFYVPTALFLDWDRTAGAINETTEAGERIGAMPRLLAVAALKGIDPEEILAEQANIEKTQSYDALSAIQNRLGQTAHGIKAFKELREQFTSHDKTLPSSVYPETPRFLRAISRARIPHGVYTAGQNPDWQADKVKSGGYRGYVEIMPMIESIQSDGTKKLKSPAKGPTITAVRTSETYDFAGLDDVGRVRAVVSAKEAVLIDDKVESAKGMPEDSSRALILQRPGEKVSERQAGELPLNATKIEALPDQDWIDAHRPEIDYGRVVRYVPLAAL